MKLSISEVADQPGAEMSFDYILEEMADTGDVVFTGPVKVKGKLINTGTALELAAEVKARIQSVCSRCLEKIELPLDFEFTERYVLQGESGEKSPVEQDFSAELTCNNETIDLKEAVEENLLINAPMRILCREDCPGLCPQCGHNLKEGPCSCKREEIDTRLAILRKLKEN